MTPDQFFALQWLAIVIVGMTLAGLAEQAWLNRRNKR